MLVRLRVLIQLLSKPKHSQQALEVVARVETNNLAVKIFLGDTSSSNLSHLDFKTWYHPDICHYLLQLTPNQAKCIRVIFSDAGYGNNRQTFKDQLQQLVMLGNAFRRPAKANQTESYRYLRYLLTELPKCKTPEQLRLLLPQHCKNNLLQNNS